MEQLPTKASVSPTETRKPSRWDNSKTSTTQHQAVVTHPSLPPTPTHPSNRTLSENQRSRENSQTQTQGQSSGWKEKESWKDQQHGQGGGTGTSSSVLPRTSTNWSERPDWDSNGKGYDYNRYDDYDRYGERNSYGSDRNRSSSNHNTSSRDYDYEREKYDNRYGYGGGGGGGNGSATRRDDGYYKEDYYGKTSSRGHDERDSERSSSRRNSPDRRESGNGNRISGSSSAPRPPIPERRRQGDSPVRTEVLPKKPVLDPSSSTTSYETNSTSIDSKVRIKKEDTPSIREEFPKTNSHSHSDSEDEKVKSKSTTSKLKSNGDGNGLKRSKSKTSASSGNEDSGDESSSSSGSSTSSKSTSQPPPAKSVVTKSKAIPKTTKQKPRSPMKPVQLINHLPRAETSALKSFVEMESCTYARGLGKSRGQTDGDGMVCECSWRFGPDPPTTAEACGEDSDCINRLTQVECLESTCHCTVSCQNQRFQKKEYADVQVVQTEKKGYGIRAGSEITNDQFIYEYIGEVIPHETFMKKMQKYKDEGIQHFYFMMLQKDEYLDATKKGGKGRFLNHSCNPNCYVAKWHVGKHMRMGIFAKRDIVAGEELTFNYNVDRYGNDAQECFCGEPNCVGSIGGKTQTDIGGMDDLFISALGIEDEVAELEARGTKKKKSKHLDDDFNPILQPMDEDEVPKVMTAVRQATANRRVLSKLLARIHMTEDTQVQKLLVRLHGFSLMAAVLEDWKDDKEIVTLTLGSLARWPLIARNKVVSAGVDQQVNDFCNSKDSEIKNLAKGLVEAWDALEVSYRIAKKEAAERDGESKEGESQDDIWQDRRRGNDEITLDTAQAPNAVSAQLSRIVPRPLGTQVPSKPYLGRLGLPPKSRFSHSHHGLESPTTPGTPRSPGTHPSMHGLQQGLHNSSPSTTPLVPSLSISEIIRLANENEEKQRKAALEAAEQERERERAALAAEKKLKRSHSSSGKHSDKDKEKRRREKEKERERKKRKTYGESSAPPEASSSATGPMDSATLERRLEKLVGEIVVGAMSKQKDKLEKDEFKKYAKDLTATICAKEKKNPKSWPPASGRLDSFPDEKRTKIKAFAKEWISKLLQRKEEEEAKLREGNHSATASTSQPFIATTTTPTSADGTSNTTLSASISTPRDAPTLSFSNGESGKPADLELNGVADQEMEVDPQQ